MYQIHETLSPGAVMRGRYLVIALIGTGGFSAVYLVQDQQREDSFFALKEVIATDKETIEHFTFECSLLERRIQPEKRFSLPVITAILVPIVDAIEYLHQQDIPIIHRDIKPSNIIVRIVEVKTILVDFGIAKVYDTQGTTSAVRHGSPGYGAPEHYSEGTNARTDIYGLGATLYTLL